ncbi:MAG: hypothetical protein B6D56_01515 [Candidatus Omnitrophica bacterium 4484_70.1]|nr:MAG: hypothetical protein B6D56_01515 [Candidatus Omnitrophica bacterium 4484_70.1]
MLVKEIMTREVITVSPDDSLKNVGEILKEKRISGLPVVKDEKIVGIITLTDMLKVLERIYKWKELEKREPGLALSEMFEKEKADAKVKDFMSKEVLTLNEDDTIEEVMRLMFARGIHTLPVVKEDKLVGIVGKRDLVYACF